MITNEINATITNTKDCINQLKIYKPSISKWKRIAKKTIKTLYDETIIRVFADDKSNTTFYTVVSFTSDPEVYIIEDYNMSILFKLIDDIGKRAKNYYTFDGYGQIYINIKTKDLYIVGSDCGYLYSTKNKSTLSKEMEDGFDFDVYEKDFIEFNQHPELISIPTVNWEAECSPGTIDYILIGNINNINY